MKQLWFNSRGILHDGIGLLLCSYCPCEEPPSSSESSSVSESESESSVSESESDSGVITECCEGVAIPQVLNMVFTGGTCAGSYTLIWRPDTLEWTSDDGPPNTNARLQCNVTTWELVITLDTWSPTSVSCDPFELVFDVFDNPFCGDFTITITG